VSPDKRQRNSTTINILSDNILLEVFDQYRKSDHQFCLSPYCVWKWHLLVHVCRRWRQIIFASPRRLNLHLLCTHGNPLREILGIWPSIPFIILFFNPPIDNVIAALEQPNRVSRIKLVVNKSQLVEIAASMQEPFPELTHLSISSLFGNVPELPNGFLGGSAPSLQHLDLCNVLYPALSTLLLSAGNLVNLSLHDIPPTGYISSELMVSLVAPSPKLEILHIQFSHLSSFPDIILSPPITRTVLPALFDFTFSGASKYLEDVVSRIDTPQLHSILVYYYPCGDITFDVPQLSKFIDRSETLTRALSGHCKIRVGQDQNIVTFRVGHTTTEQWNPEPAISVCLGAGIEGKISHLTNILGHSFPILSGIVHCTIDSVQFISESASSSEPEDRDDFNWLQLLRQLSSLQTLFVSDNIAGLISQALAYVDGGMITEVLPTLKLLCLEGSEEEEGQPAPSVHNFLAVRRESGHPVTFVKTNKEFEEIFKSYP
jgi:hypothetical protein